MARVGAYALLLLAAILAVAAILGIKWYVWDIAIGEAGAADRSMLFWGLPILFLSLAAGGAAFGAVFFSRRLMSRS